MALTRANAAHPIGQMTTTAEAPVPAPTVPPPPAAVETKAPAAKAAPTRAPRARRETKARTSPGRSTPARSTTTTTVPATKPVEISKTSLDGIVLPAAAPAARETRAVRERSKRDFTLWMPVADLERLKAEFRAHRAPYRAAKREQDPNGTYALTQAGFTWAALNYALDRYQKWVLTVPNDGRNGGEAVARRQMVVGWPTEAVERFQLSWETLEAEVAWPDGYTLTKANLSATGIMWALDRVEKWIGDVPNDDRYTVPA